jgi:biotin carboxyl carrier protein
MPGVVIAVHAAAGDVVELGDAVVTLEAMKMEHAALSPRAGRLSDILVAVGDQVVRGQLLATVGD